MHEHKTPADFFREPFIHHRAQLTADLLAPAADAGREIVLEGRR